MFIRRKGNSFYLVENQRINGKVKQKVVQYLGVNPNDKIQYQPKLNIIYQGKVQDFLTKLPDDSCDCIIADQPYFIIKERVFRRSQQKDIQQIRTQRAFTPSSHLSWSWKAKASFTSSLSGKAAG